MTNSSVPVLPEGFRDDFPPESARARALANRMLNCFEQHGYALVTPSLVEYAETLLEGPSASLSANLFRFADPQTQQLLAIRSDMTVQIARIAETRFKGTPRPLRLAYGGEVLRVKGSQLRPERQFMQIGCELIGSNRIEADVEMIRLAVKSLELLGVDNLCVDLALPVVPLAIADDYAITGKDRAAFLNALRHRDQSEIEKLRKNHPKAVACTVDLLNLPLEATAGVKHFDGLDMPDRVTKELQHLKEVYHLLQSHPGPGTATISVDPLEMQGFDYQNGLCFTIFVKGQRTALGRGGRYVTGRLQEVATGFSCYMSSVMRIVSENTPRTVLYIPWGNNPLRAEKFRQEGKTVIEGLAPLSKESEKKEAKALGCTIFCSKDGIENVT